MNAFKFMCQHCSEKELMGILLVFLTRFAVFPRGFPQPPFSTSRIRRLRPGKLLNLKEHVENEQDDFKYHFL